METDERDYRDKLDKKNLLSYKNRIETKTLNIRCIKKIFKSTLGRKEKKYSH